MTRRISLQHIGIALTTLSLAALACNVPVSAPTPTAVSVPEGQPSIAETPPAATAEEPTATLVEEAPQEPTATLTEETPEEPAAAPVEETSGAPPAAPVAIGDPCALYTQAEIEAMFGESASVADSGTAPDSTGRDMFYCVYATTSGYYVTINVIPTSSEQAAAQAYQESKAMFGLSQPVSLGDEAGFQHNIPIVGSVLIARQGVYLVSVTLVPGGDSAGNPAPPLDEATASQRTQEVMAAVLSRLP